VHGFCHAAAGPLPGPVLYLVSTAWRSSPLSEEELSELPECELRERLVGPLWLEVIMAGTRERGSPRRTTINGSRNRGSAGRAPLLEGGLAEHRLL
jgi:hypothetical protein